MGPSGLVWPFAQPRPAGLVLCCCRYGPAPRAGLAQPPALSGPRGAEWQAGRQAAAGAIFALTGTGAWPGTRPDRGPHWPAGLVGAITHHRGLALALVGQQDRFTGLGIDHETRIDDIANLAPLILTGAERAAGVDPLSLTLAFSAKESLYKALAPQIGRFFGFDAAEVVTAGPDAAVLRLTQHLAPAWPAGRCIPVAVAWRRDRVLTAVMLDRAD
ncbi:4'-phosphopantetheinyl transferase [Paracoccus sp. p4-l81]|uniref:4'-phosphopantetheinyl transferase family protein n=1 Tax=unclassified Paracoccus (in: a-proteobacteria) TaxID=2688777 RepID=UPI0035BA8F25